MLFISRNDTHEEYSICLQIDWIVYSAAAKGVIDCYSLQELLFSQIKFCSTQTHKGLLLQKLQLQYRQKTSLLPGKVISAGSMVSIVLPSLPLLLFFVFFLSPTVPAPICAWPPISAQSTCSLQARWEQIFIS